MQVETWDESLVLILTHFIKANIYVDTHAWASKSHIEVAVFFLQMVVSLNISTNHNLATAT